MSSHAQGFRLSSRRPRRAEQCLASPRRLGSRGIVRCMDATGRRCAARSCAMMQRENNKELLAALADRQSRVA